MLCVGMCGEWSPISPSPCFWEEWGWGPEEGCSARGRIQPCVRSLTWSWPLAVASPQAQLGVGGGS